VTGCGSRSQCKAPIQKQKPATVSTVYGRRPGNCWRRISHTHGSGAIQANGHQSTGGRAAQRRRAPRKAGIHKEREDGKREETDDDEAAGDRRDKLAFLC